MQSPKEIAHKFVKAKLERWFPLSADESCHIINDIGIELDIVDIIEKTRAECAKIAEVYANDPNGDEASFRAAMHVSKLIEGKNDLSHGA